MKAQNYQGFAATAIVEKSDVLQVMKAIVESKQSCVKYDSLCTMIGQEALDSLIKYNLVHLRPCAAFPSDIEDDRSGFPAVTPHMPCDLLLMKQMLVTES